jgi:hypothetical protein
VTSTYDPWLTEFGQTAKFSGSSDVKTNQSPSLASVDVLRTFVDSRPKCSIVDRSTAAVALVLTLQSRLNSVNGSWSYDFRRFDKITELYDSRLFQGPLTSKLPNLQLNLVSVELDASFWKVG